MLGRVLLVVLAVSAAPVLAGPALGLIEFQDGKLSANASGTPARTVFAALAEKAGVQVRASESLLTKPVTVSFRALEVEQGMRQIVRSLAASGYAVLYDGDRVTYMLMDSEMKTGPVVAPATAVAAAAGPTDALTKAMAERARLKREERHRTGADKKLQQEERKRAQEERRRAREEEKAKKREERGRGKGRAKS
jgi:hypothetical protein